MNKPPQKYKHSDSKIKPHKWDYKKSLLYGFIIIFAAIPLVLGKYYEFNSPDPFDSAANVYSAQRILNGARIGVDEIPSAALGTLLVNILGVKIFGFSEFGPKLIQGIFQAAALVLMFFAMRKLFGTLAAAIGVIVASSYLSFPYIAKFGNVKEQYMIACMVIGISCFILYQLDGKRLFACLAGAFLVWAPLFKETGLSALGALGLFLLAQPFLKNRSWKQTFGDMALLALGAIIAIAPLYIWMIGCNINPALPYSSIWKIASGTILPAKTAEGTQAASYVSQARKIMPYSELLPRFLRFCLTLILPVALAIGSIIARLIRMVRPTTITPYDRFILLLAIWWILDMAFVWVSPRSYEQYYLPLNASAAFLSGYLICLYSDAFAAAQSKQKWFLIGAVGLVCMIAMSWHIFAGIKKSPWSGMDYGEKRKGYIQAYDEIAVMRKEGLKGTWEILGNYIRHNSIPSDKIYVWGWYPGIYVQAQRFSPSPKAFESEMHIRPPQELADTIQKVVSALQKDKPKFIVDSRKRHLPLDRPPFELWPIMPEGFMDIKEPAFLPTDKTVINLFDQWWTDMLRKRFGEDEALRYEAMRPLRKFVMSNYHVVKIYDPHRLFELNTEENKQTKENK